MSIIVLPPEVAAKIAAGEVVERPANVVKELVENSIDAGATEIRVEIREGGRRLLRVSDNGQGIPAAEAPLAFERHATSKLHTFEDLSRIATFGFRGEALYSIAAVSQLTLTTRHRSEDFGTVLRIVGGRLEQQSRAGAPVGTVVNVEQLFFNVPARQKFLRAPATEAGQIGAVIQRFALAYPDRRFSYTSDGRLLFQSAGSGSLFDVLVKIHGLDNARQMVAVGEAPQSWHGGDNTAGSAPGSPTSHVPPAEADIEFMADVGQPTRAGDESVESRIDVVGYVSLPSLTRSNRSAIDLFVNHRSIEDRTLAHAVVQAFHTLLPVGRYPLATIFVTLDPAEVDVNVHPQKTQVRFAQERRVFSAVQKAVRRALVGAVPAPDMTMDEEGRILPASGPGGQPAPDVATWFARRDTIVNIDRQHHLDLYVPSPSSQGRTLGLPASSAGPTEWPAEETAGTEPAGTESAGTENDKPAGEQAGSAAAGEGRPEAVNPPPASSGAPTGPLGVRTSQLPPLRVVGQVGAMYIVAEGPEGMFLIDQHAAHERILYEKYLAQRYGTAGGTVAKQHLLEPLTLHVGTRLAGLVASHLVELQHLGFEVEPFGGDTFLVRAAPASLAGEDPLRVLEEIASSLAERRNQVGEDLEDALVKMVCKRAAIKAGQLLSDLEMRELVRQLEECQSPRTCPHGRPTVIQLPAAELEKAFGRT
ncbi:MAG: DNA mismatch repair endonuclease MutL [Caldilineaceae bacterium]